MDSLKKPMFVLPDEKIAAWLGHTTLLKGKAYFRDSRISQVQCAGTTLRATCTGTQLAPYNLWVSWKTNGITDANCSCPVGRDGKCKHIAALLVHYRQPQGRTSVTPPTSSPIKTNTVMAYNHTNTTTAANTATTNNANETEHAITVANPAQETPKQQPQLHQPTAKQVTRSQLPTTTSTTSAPQPATVPKPQPQMSSRTPGFSLEHGWKDMKVKTPKKRKPPSFQGSPPNPTTTLPSTTPTKAFPTSPPTTTYAESVPAPNHNISSNNDADLDVVSVTSNEPTANPVAQPPIVLSEVQELKVKNILLQWQVHTLRAKLASSIDPRHTENKEQDQQAKQQAQPQQKESKQQQQKQYQIPFLVSGRELKEKKMREKEVTAIPITTNSNQSEKEMTSLRDALKRNRAVQEKKPVRPTKKARISPEISAIFSQHNRDLDTDYSMSNADANTTTATNTSTNANAPSEPRQDKHHSDSRLLKKSKDIPANAAEKAPAKDTLVASNNKLPRTMPFFDIKNFLDVEADVEGKKRKRKELEDGDEEHEEMYEEDEIEDEDEIERRNRSRKNRHKRRRAQERKPEPDLKQQALQHQPKEQKPVEGMELGDKQPQEPNATDNTTNADLTNDVALTELWTQVPMMSTQDFMSFVEKTASGATTTATATTMSMSASTSNMPPALTPTTTPIKRTNALTNLMAFNTKTEAKVKAQPNTTTAPENTSTELELDPFADDFSLSQLPTSLSQVNFSGAELDWAMEQLKSVMSETGFSLSLTQT